MKKKPEHSKNDDLREDYDAFGPACAAGMPSGSMNLVLLAPYVAAAFPDAKAVNDALRLLMTVAKQSVLNGT